MTNQAGVQILGPEQRREAWQRLGSEQFDVVVIGGGVVGAGAALDAATRGLRVALVEARDFASGTSSRSSKMFHGGLRYLEQLEFGLVREALRERELSLTTLAPHLVKPLEFYNQVNRYRVGNSRIPPEFLIPPLELLGMHAVNLVRFSLGVLAAALAVWGVVRMIRRRSTADWIILAAIAGYTLILLPLHWPLIRYDLPLTVLLGICAGIALERRGRWRLWITAAALVMSTTAVWTRSFGISSRAVAAR